MGADVNNDAISVEQAQTIDGLFRERVRRSPDAVAYRYFNESAAVWEEISWSSMAHAVAHWQTALRREGLAHGERVALMLPNCCQWVQFEQAALGLGLVVVPLYFNDRPDNIAYILRETDARLLLIQGHEQWQQLSESLQDIPTLSGIVSLNPVYDTNTDVQPLAEWLTEADSEPEYRAASPDDLATIVYTSGTVGRPKGVMLSHRNILWNAWACLQVVRVSRHDLFLSFLPLSHMLERTVGYVLPMMTGATVAYARSIPQLADDLMTIRPTILISVPRIYERIYARIATQLKDQSALARSLFRLAVNTGWRRFEFGQRRRGWHVVLLLWPLLKRLVADRVMMRLGGRIRIAVCGGAPLGMAVARMFIGLGLSLLNGYGMTEASPVLNANRPDSNDPAGVGPALAGVEECIGQDDELLARSPGIMLGYWRNEEATARAIDHDGWLHTGDKVRIREGHVYITGRLKDIIVMSNGEKVSPTDMELALALDPIVEQVMVVGESKPYLTALLVLNQHQWISFASLQQWDSENPTVLEQAVVQNMICQRLARQLKDFPGYAQVRRVAVLPEPWTVENNLLTPTLKLRRNRILAQYDDIIDRLYEGH